MGEYLASGRPVVTNAVGEIDRFLADGKTALIAPPGDQDAFARKIEQALTDPAAARRIGLAGKRVAEQHFHYSRYGDRLVEFFNELLPAH